MYFGETIYVAGHKFKNAKCSILLNIFKDRMFGIIPKYCLIINHFYTRSLLKKRIIFIRDMLDDEGNLLGFEYFIHKYNINTNVIKLCIVDECCKNIFTYTIQFHYNSV